MTVSEF